MKNGHFFLVTGLMNYLLLTFQKNFVAFQFYRSFLHEENIEFMGSSDEDFMVLNLISRKTYWVKVNPLAVKLK